MSFPGLWVPFPPILPDQVHCNAVLLLALLIAIGHVVGLVLFIFTCFIRRRDAVSRAWAMNFSTALATVVIDHKVSDAPMLELQLLRRWLRPGDVEMPPTIGHHS